MSKSKMAFNMFVYPSLFLGILLLVGCGSNDLDDLYLSQRSSSSYTPCHTKHAKRGYNKPYTIKGVRYTPQPHYEINETGIASYYGGTDVFHGRPTSTGKIFDKNYISAAHKTAALPCVVWVTNLENGRRIKVEVNDRGPFIEGRVIDVSRKTAQLLGFYHKGTARVHVETALPETLLLARGELHEDVIQLAEVCQHENLETLVSLGDLEKLESPVKVKKLPKKAPAFKQKDLENVFQLASQQETSNLDEFSENIPVKQIKRKARTVVEAPSLDSLVHQVMASEEENLTSFDDKNQKSFQNSKTKTQPFQSLSGKIQKRLLASNTIKSVVAKNQFVPKIIPGFQGYYVHAATFKSDAAAQNTYQKLQKIFTPAAVRRETVHFGDTKFLKVLVGPLRSQQEADTLLKKVSSAGMKTATVIYNG